jgi:hypothetical protein
LAPVANGNRRLHTATSATDTPSCQDIEKRYQYGRKQMQWNLYITNLSTKKNDLCPGNIQ